MISKSGMLGVIKPINKGIPRIWKQGKRMYKGLTIESDFENLKRYKLTNLK